MPNPIISDFKNDAADMFRLHGWDSGQAAVNWLGCDAIESFALIGVSPEDITHARRVLSRLAALS